MKDKTNRAPKKKLRKGKTSITQRETWPGVAAGSKKQRTQKEEAGSKTNIGPRVGKTNIPTWKRAGLGYKSI